MIYKYFFKRFLDVFISVFLLILFSPLMLFIALGIVLTSGFPVFFVQERPGLRENIFKIYKFRTMSNKKDDSGQLLPDRLRITFIGKLLRKYSLDELPELLNVIKGDMSLVGPRPLLVSYLPYYTEKEKKRHLVRPGISGLAQVSGRNSLDWSTRLELDAQYVEKLSFWLDVKILLLTIGAVFLSKGVSIDSGEIEPSLIEYRKKEKV